MTTDTDAAGTDGTSTSSRPTTGVRRPPEPSRRQRRTRAPPTAHARPGGPPPRSPAAPPGSPESCSWSCCRCSTCPCPACCPDPRYTPGIPAAAGHVHADGRRGPDLPPAARRRRTALLRPCPVLRRRRLRAGDHPAEPGHPAAAGDGPDPAGRDRAGPRGGQHQPAGQRHPLRHGHARVRPGRLGDRGAQPRRHHRRRRRPDAAHRQPAGFPRGRGQYPQPLLAGPGGARGRLHRGHLGAVLPRRPRRRRGPRERTPRPRPGPAAVPRETADLRRLRPSWSASSAWCSCSCRAAPSRGPSPPT